MVAMAAKCVPKACSSVSNPGLYYSGPTCLPWVQRPCRLQQSNDESMAWGAQAPVQATKSGNWYGGSREVGRVELRAHNSQSLFTFLHTTLHFSYVRYILLVALLVRRKVVAVQRRKSDIEEASELTLSHSHPSSSAYSSSVRAPAPHPLYAHNHLNDSDGPTSKISHI